MGADDRKYAIQGRADPERLRVDHFLRHMDRNAAYRHAADLAGGDPDGRLLAEFRERYRRYREDWRGLPRRVIAEGLLGERLRAEAPAPLCVNLEIAAVCDLACPFCYRQWIATPDRIMDEALYRRAVDEMAEMGVPSLKLNWRGEPILHPKVAEFVDYAKRKGILEVGINTNAVTLDEAKSRALLRAGLDMIIYSFDGGTPATYNRMRVGRTRENAFEPVYENIRRFARLRAEAGTPLPLTKIQMILTAETFPEQEAFFRLFDDCVDDVSVKAYTERGGKIEDLDPPLRARLADFLRRRGISEDTAFWRDMDGRVFVSEGRLPCEQPFQRLMVTYDGRVSMCCYDWGSEHPVGYLSEAGFRGFDRDHDEVVDRARRGAKGFEGMGRLRRPRPYAAPPERVSTLRDLWSCREIEVVRRAHLEGRVEEVPVCRRCPFKETYRWVEPEERT